MPVFRTVDPAGYSALRIARWAEVSWLTGLQRWAVDVAVEARLELDLWGAVFVRGDVGPFTPYLPSGAYL